MVDVSVIIATHNRASMVGQAIDSVLSQSKPVREVIVVDDGSSDENETQRTLSGYGDRIRAFFRPQGGASAARNFGMQAARGGWIAFLDDDDVWLPAKIERQMNIVADNPNVGLVYCSDYAVDENLRVLYTREAAPENRGDVFERLLMKNFIFTSCVIARKDAVERANYMRSDLRFAQDWDLWLKISVHATVDFVTEPLVLYRQSAVGCLTRDMSATEKLLELRTIVDGNRSLVSDRVYSCARQQVELQWASSSLKEGKNGQAFLHSMRAIRCQPGSANGYRLLAHSLAPKAAREWARRFTVDGGQQG